MIYPWLKPYAQVHPVSALCLTGVSGLGIVALGLHWAQENLQTKQLDFHPDFFSLTSEPGKSIGIESIREIRDFCLISPTLAASKVVFLEKAEALTVPAQQAFLKTLEEPVVPVNFILITSRVNQLLPTLRSRCQVLTIPPVPFAQAKIWYEEQNLTLSAQDYRLTEGGPLLVQEPGFIDRQTAYQFLQALLQEQRTDDSFVKTLLKADPLDVLSGFYYALMHHQQFKLLDACVALRRLFSLNSSLNWDIQFKSFILEVKNHAR